MTVIRSFIFAISVSLLLMAKPCFGQTVRNTLVIQDHPLSVLTQRSCGAYTYQPSPHWCNPALFPFTIDSSIKADSALTADQNAYEVTDHLMNRPLTKDFVDDLFRKHDFQAFSALTRLEALSTYLSFSYTPVYLVGLYQLSNPNLPELKASALSEESYRITSGLIVSSTSHYSLSIGGSLALYERTFYDLRVNAIDVVVRDVNEFIATSEEKGVDGDVGLFFQSKRTSSFKGLNVGLTGENLARGDPGDEDRFKLVKPLTRRRTLTHLGSSYESKFGVFSLNLKIVSRGIFEIQDDSGYSTSFIYGIGRLRSVAAFSPHMTSLGFLFMSSYYNIGVQYTNEKQDNSLDLRRKKNVNFLLSLHF